LLYRLLRRAIAARSLALFPIPAERWLPPPKFEAKNVDNGSVYEAGSSTTGNYVIPQLPTGNYELTVTVSGFKKYVKENIFLPVA
jgi:hypothetical protein